MFIEYGRKTIPPSPEDYSGRQLWRAGRHLLRINYVAGGTGSGDRKISIGRDEYTVSDRPYRVQHTRTNSPDGEPHVYILARGGPKALMALEIGNEVELFKELNASRGPDESVGRVPCAVYTLNIEPYRLKLYVNQADGDPRELVVKTAQLEFSIQYNRYERRKVFVAAWFAPPDQPTQVMVAADNGVKDSGGDGVEPPPQRHQSPVPKRTQIVEDSQQRQPDQPWVVSVPRNFGAANGATKVNSFVSTAVAVDFQTYIEYRIVPEDVNAAPMDARKIWKAGTRFARIEEPVDPRIRVQAVTIVNEPDIYIFDLTAKRGRHMKDPDSNGSGHFPIFNDQASGAALEIGQELEFFKAQHATRERDEVLDDVKCAVFRLIFDRDELRLFVDLSARIPRRIKIKTPKNSFSIFYDKYVRKEPIDPALYRPPENIVLIGGDAPIKQRPAIATPFETLPDFRSGLGFSARRIDSGVLGETNFTCRARPVVLLFFDPEKPDGQKVTDHIADLYRQYQRSQACFIALPRRGGRAKALAGKYGFPVYRLESFSDGGEPPDSYWENNRNMAIYRNGDINGKPVPFDDAIKEVIETRLPGSESEDDIGTEIGDMPAQWKRVDGELSEKKIDRLKTLLDGRKFAEIDRHFAEARKQKLLGSNGGWWLPSSYRAIKGSDRDEGRLRKQMALMTEWIDQYPESITPRVVLGKLWLRYAWMGRGGGYADTMTEQQRTNFAWRLVEARKVLMEARELEEKCPELYVTMLNLAKGEGWPRDEIDAMFREGQKLEPQYQYLYVEMAHLLLPKWYGEPGEWEEFARKIADENPAGRGDELYARIALLMALKDEGDFTLETIFKKSDLSWALVKRGEEAIRLRFPDSKMNSNYFAFLACAAGDRKTAREAFQRIGDDYAISVWGNRIVYEHSRRWANRP